MSPSRNRHRERSRQTAEKKKTPPQNVEDMSPAEKYAHFRKRQAYENSDLGMFAATYHFEFDDFQVDACEALLQSQDVLVAAPTSSGKTIVAEFAAYLAVKEGVRLFYTTPIKALSNQKYHDFCSRFGEEKVGLLTGDTAVNGGAQVVIMTTEVLRNMLYDASKDLRELGYVVMDEVHYLADRFRGPVWEEVIINLPSQIRLISLSATVSNAEEFGQWLQEVRSATAVIVSEKRPVPLYQYMMVGKDLFELYRSTDKNTASARVNPKLLAALAGKRHGHWRNFLPKRAQIIESLDRSNFLPAIVFIFSRAGCDKAADQIFQRGVSLTTEEEARIIRDFAEERLASIPYKDQNAIGIPHWIEMLSQGIGVHHAGLLPVMKEITEDLFCRGLVQVVYATETLALGVNMPARTVFLEDLTKWNGAEHATLTPGEYTQLTGRAGRRGIDTHGNAVVLYDPQTPPELVSSLASKRSYPLHSAFRPTYNMAVNMLAYSGVSQIHSTIEKSFAQFEADRRVGSLAVKAKAYERRAQENWSRAECPQGNIRELAELTSKQAKLQKNRRAGKRQGTWSQSELDAADKEIQSLGESIRSHSCFTCPDRAEHLHFAREAVKLEEASLKLVKRIRARTSSLSSQLERILELLEELGYLDKDQKVTTKGEILRKIYGERDLFVAEALAQGIWDHLPASILAAVASGAVFESRNDFGGQTIPAATPGKVTPALRSFEKLSTSIRRAEANHHLPPLPALDFGLAPAIYAWAEGASLAEVIDIAEISSGDFVRWCRQTIDILQQLAGISTPVQNTAKAAADLLRRGVVAWQEL